MAVISIRKKHLMTPQEPLPPPPAPYDDTALRKELAEVCADLKAVRGENADLKKRLEEIQKTVNVSHETEKPDVWNFKIERNNDGTIRSVKAVEQSVETETEQADVPSVLYGR